MVAIEHYAKTSTILAATSDITTTTTPSPATAELTTAEVTNNNNNNSSSNNNNHNNIRHISSDNNNSTTTATTITATTTTATTTNTKIPPKLSENDADDDSEIENMTEPTTNHNDVACKSAVSQRNVDIKIGGKKANTELAKQELTKKMLKLDLTGKDLDDYSLKSPKSPISARLPHQTSLTSSVDVEDRKTLRDALYQGIFHRHRRTIFAVGSFLRMLRSRNSQYNSIRSSSEGEDVDDR